MTVLALVSRKARNTGMGQHDCPRFVSTRLAAQAWVSAAVLLLYPGRLVAQASVSTTILGLVSMKALSTGVCQCNCTPLVPGRLVAQAWVSTTVLTLMSRKARSTATGVGQHDRTRSCVQGSAPSPSLPSFSLVGWGRIPRMARPVESTDMSF
jgi:hypothetical protein